MATKIPGLQEDIDTFISTFRGLQSLSYEGFVDIWNSMKFDAIFSGRKSVSEVKFLTNEIFSYLVNRTAACFTKEERVCSLYLLYGLYHVQPLENKVRIRIELDQWQDLSFFMKSVKSECIEVFLCFNKLKFGLAFDYVEALPLYTLETVNDRKTTEEVVHRIWEGNEKYKEVIEGDVLNSVDTDKEWEEMQESYNSLKDQLKTLSFKDDIIPKVTLEKRNFNLGLSDKSENRYQKQYVNRHKNKSIQALWQNERLVLVGEEGFEGSDSIEENALSVDDPQPSSSGLSVPIISVVAHNSATSDDDND